MAENINRSILWNEGGKAALALGAVSVVYNILVTLLSKLSGGTAIAATVSVVGFLLWAAKFAGCIFLMRFFMLQIVKKYPGASNRDTFRFGRISALLSSLIVAAYSLASILLTSEEKIVAEINSKLGESMSMLDLNSQNAMQAVLDNIQVYVFFSVLIYCFLFGYILSLILSRNIPSSNPFEDTGGVQPN